MQLTDTQHRILVALCRPARSGNGFAPPATNQEIAEEVFLSVDAVKAHLRALYRKFGIEELPQNQKRARLVELVLEGEYLGERKGEAPSRDGTRDRRLPVAALVAAAAVVLLAILALAGIFSGGGDGGETTGVAAYRSAVDGYCRLGLDGAGGVRGDTRERARSYLAVIETVRGRVESLPPPAESDHALDRFRAGLTAAADYTSVVAEEPPAAGSREQANVVAELTLAAGQVQAGALGYQLGSACVAVGDLVTRSARNAAHAP